MVNQDQGTFLLSKLHQLYQNNHMCDVRLLVKGKTAREVHGVVLSSFSSYFHERITNQKIDNTTDMIDVEFPGALYLGLAPLNYTTCQCTCNNIRLKLPLLDLHTCILNTTIIPFIIVK